MQTIQFLHIPKTGGTAFKQAFLRNAAKPKALVLNGHGVTFSDVVEKPGARCIFFVRDIATRYVSGFNSRLRMGRPFTEAKWDEGEIVAFKQFQTPNELAEALTSHGLERRRAAQCAMANIWHTRFPLHFWLHSAAYLEAHRDRILFIARQEHLTDDFRTVIEMIGGDADVELPADPVRSHQTPDGFSSTLSPLGEQNIRDWYREDRDILDWCYEFRVTSLAHA